MSKQCSEEIFNESEIEIDEPNEYIKYDITSYPGPFTLTECARRYEKSSNVFIIPDFQRNESVWEIKRKAKLIESFLVGLPVPPVFLYTENRSQYQIIDGLQRINAITSFFKNEFQLEGLNEKSPYANKRFCDLSEDDKVRLETSFLSATIIQQLAPKDSNSCIYEIFSRLNTGGVKLNNMEVRRCLSYGSFLKTLEYLNKNKHWREIIGIKQEHKRFLDVELILRILALYETSYKAPLRAFLDSYMNENKSKQRDDLKNTFKVATEAIITNLGKTPFNGKNNRPNYAILDTVMVMVMRNPKIKELKNKFHKLLATKEFSNIIEIGHDSMTAVKIEKRIEIANTILV